ncbi:hypothetical protein NJB93_17865 [Brucella intermedia]|uniref:hypothetical protein n=1 Tax=Brucella intermedia TaxID=94625 RepID=UPI00209AF786|nr:hypothetical protein [Brucella intermedia]MCO7728457.1 hypothetical protein [Brucella intermedia]
MGANTKTNPYPVHILHTTPEEIRDAFLHIKWALERHGWATSDFTGFLGIPRQTWYQYGHKLDSKGYRRIPAVQLDLLRQQHALASFGSRDGAVDPFHRRRNRWTVGEETTFSFLKAIYMSGISGHPIVPGEDNERKPEASAQKILRWFAAARQADRRQIMAATNLGDYDIGRIGFVGNHWGMEAYTSYCERLEKIVGGNKIAA